MQAIREAGSRVIASATTVAEAVRLEELGAEAVIAQGSEAGGHRGSFLVEGDDGPIGTLALVPQVVDAVAVPVIAAGGIADGRGLAAVLALGAGAAQIGTAFLACPEADVHPAHRAAVREVAGEATTITRAFSGRPARAVRNRVSDAVPDDQALAFPAQRSLTGPLAERGAEAADLLPMWLGQAAGPGVRATGGRARRDARRRGRARARRAQSSRLTCEPPTIASEPSGKRTQALLPPS